MFTIFYVFIYCVSLVQFISLLFQNLNVNRTLYCTKNYNYSNRNLKTKKRFGKKNRGLEDLDEKCGPGQNPEQFSCN